MCFVTLLSFVCMVGVVKRIQNIFDLLPMKRVGGGVPPHEYTLLSIMIDMTICFFTFGVSLLLLMFLMLPLLLLFVFVDVIYTFLVPDEELQYAAHAYNNLRIFNDDMNRCMFVQSYEGPSVVLYKYTLIVDVASSVALYYIICTHECVVGMYVGLFSYFVCFLFFSL